MDFITPEILDVKDCGKCRALKEEADAAAVDVPVDSPVDAPVDDVVDSPVDGPIDTPMPLSHPYCSDDCNLYHQMVESDDAQLLLNDMIEEIKSIPAAFEKVSEHFAQYHDDISHRMKMNHSIMLVKTLKKNDISDKFYTHALKIQNGVEWMSEEARDAVNEALAAARETIGDAAETIGDAAETLGDNISDKLSNFLGDASDALDDATKALNEAVGGEKNNTDDKDDNTTSVGAKAPRITLAGTPDRRGRVKHGLFKGSVSPLQKQLKAHRQQNESM